MFPKKNLSHYFFPAHSYPYPGYRVSINYFSNPDVVIDDIRFGADWANNAIAMNKNRFKYVDYGDESIPCPDDHGNCLESDKQSFL